jgi:hypothetical protein
MTLRSSKTSYVTLPASTAPTPTIRHGLVLELVANTAVVMVLLGKINSNAIERPAIPGRPCLASLIESSSPLQVVSNLPG